MEQTCAECQAGLRLHPSPAKGLQIIHGPAKISSLPTAPCPLAPERKLISGGLGLCSQTQSQLTSHCCPHLCSGHLRGQGLWSSATYGDWSQDNFPCATAVPWQHIQGGSVPLRPWGWGHGLATGALCPRVGREMELLASGAVLGRTRAAEAAALTSCANQK